MKTKVFLLPSQLITTFFENGFIVAYGTDGMNKILTNTLYLLGPLLELGSDVSQE